MDQVDSEAPINNTQLLIKGAAITLLMGAAAKLTPVLGFFCLLALPQPALVYRLRIGRKNAAGMLAAAWVGLMVLTGGPGLDGLMMAALLALGFFMAEGLLKTSAIETIIAQACGLVLVLGAFCLAMYGNIHNQGLGTLISGYIDRQLEMTLSVYQGMDLPESRRMSMTGAMDDLGRVLLGILPAFIGAALLFVAWLNLLLAKLALRRNLPEYPVLFSLNTWKAPDILVWGLIGSALLLMVPLEGLNIAGANGMIFFTVIYFFQGIAVISFIFEKKKTPAALKFLLYGMILMQQILVPVVSLLGFIDIWLNFRKLGADGNNNPMPLSS